MRRNASRLTGLLPPLAAAILLGAAPSVGRAADDLPAARRSADAAFAENLAALAAICDSLGMADEARITRGWIIPRAADRLYLFLPPESDPAAPPADAPELVRRWYERFRRHRSEQAEALFRLAREQLRAGRPAEAYQLVHECLREDPDHAAARRVLGFVRVEGQWREPGVSYRTQASRVAHPRLGWPAGGYWRVTTPRYEIVTNHSPEAGETLGRRLEELFCVWRQVFTRYWATEALLAQQFDGRPVQSARRRYQVVLHRDRDDYLRALASAEPQIALTLGIYLDRARTMHLYWDESAAATWMHEGTHQLFQETRLGTGGVGEETNFWVVEAPALYMESLSRRDGYYTAGGIEAPRLQFARNRTLAGGFQVPLEELAGIGREGFQRDERLRALYSQVAGIGHFLMHYRGGKYREAMIDVLRGAYLGRPAPDLLARATAAPFAQLDREYREFLAVTDDDLAAIPQDAPITHLALGRTQVSDRGLLALGDLSRAVWLDLGGTRVSDAGAAALASAAALADLNLEHTAITDAALRHLAGLTELEELDLSGTRISDAGLAHLAGLTKLRVLWLSHTQVSDAGLRHLSGLSRLERLEVEGSRVTPAGYHRLRETLPRLAAPP